MTKAMNREHVRIPGNKVNTDLAPGDFFYIRIAGCFYYNVTNLTFFASTIGLQFIEDIPLICFEKNNHDMTMTRS